MKLPGQDLSSCGCRGRASPNVSLLLGTLRIHPCQHPAAADEGLEMGAEARMHELIRRSCRDYLSGHAKPNWVFVHELNGCSCINYWCALT